MYSQRYIQTFYGPSRVSEDDKVRVYLDPHELRVLTIALERQAAELERDRDFAAAARVAERAAILRATR